MRSVYKSTRGQSAVRTWCLRTLARSDFAVTTKILTTSTGEVTLTSAGTGPPRVVLVPGTGFNAAVTLPWLRALSAHWPTTVVDLPGQPGLSDQHRPRRARLAWYGYRLNEILNAMNARGVVLVGNSLGAAVALAADSPRIRGRALISPAGFIRLTIDPKLALASTAWLLHPSPGHTRSMLRLFVPPGADAPETEVEWMTLMASCCRTTLAPPPLPSGTLSQRATVPCIVGVGDHDRFLPPHRLVPAVRRTMNLDVQILPGMGHLTTPNDLEEVVTLVAQLVDKPAT